jgi:hypothetical protein
MRRTLASLMPAAAAMVRSAPVRRVAGFCYNVVFTTLFARGSVMMRLRPGPRSVLFQRCHTALKKRFRQRAAFPGAIPIRCAICWFELIENCDKIAVLIAVLVTLLTSILFR